MGIPVDRLLAELNEAGIQASAETILTDADQFQLLGYLRRSHRDETPESMEDVL